ncbi:MAG: hypothetical protein CMC65_06525 [Flavobacteriaceae bacterium]|nr:hypothetical protein [Flavobacteriaceae bacterium]|tara:strand:- start:6400 stop:7659 length:1260 start_codon:yes stop_codon:yes gene_type:complete
MIAILKKEIETKLDQKILNRGDCELLSNAILETIDIKISYNTIRRLFGLAPNVKANKKTLNTLSKFIGYKHYIHFMQTYLQQKPKNLSVLVFRAVYHADKAEIIKLVQNTKSSHEDFVSFIIILSRELLYNKEYSILNQVFELEELAYENFSYSEVLFIGNSIGLLLRKQNLRDQAFINNTNFLRCVYLTFVDYSNLNGYYADWTKIINKSKKTKELEIFTKAIQEFRNFLNIITVKDSFKELAFNTTLHPILCSRLLSVKIIANKYDNLEPILDKYYQIHSKHKSKIFEYSFELFITAITTKNMVLMRYIIDLIDLSKNQHLFFSEERKNLFYFMAMFYYKLTKNIAKKNKYMKLFILNTIRYSYKDYIKLLQDVFLYSEARTEPLRKSIKNDYVQLNKKLKYPYFSESYLMNYFIDK